MDTQEVKLRLRKVLEISKENPTSLSRKCGVNQKTLNNQINGDTEVSVSTLLLISKAIPGVSLEWLLRGNGEMSLSRQDDDKESEMARNDNKTPRVETRPRIPMTVAAGTLTGFSDIVYLNDCQQVPVVKSLPNYDYTIIVKGDSMEPKFEGGDEIAIRKVSDFIEWGKPYVLDTRDGAVLKRLYDEGEQYRCVSYNDEYPDFTVDKADVFGVYKVVGLIRI